MAKDLTTTSYAILGLLSLRPWTTYELAIQMDRSLSNFWPRAQSRLYEEPKRLVAEGLARSRREYTGNRPRTIYSITVKGRRALRRWLDEPGAEPRLEFEGILKVFFADQGTKEQLLENIASIRRWTEAGSEQGAAFLHQYAETGGPFPERLHIIYLMTNFLTHHGRAIEEWATWAEEEVQSWPDTVTPVDREVFRQMLEGGSDDVARNRTAPYPSPG